MTDIVALGALLHCLSGPAAYFAEMQTFEVSHAFSFFEKDEKKPLWMICYHIPHQGPNGNVVFPGKDDMCAMPGNVAKALHVRTCDVDSK